MRFRKKICTRHIRKGQLQIWELVGSGLSGELLDLIHLTFLVQHRPEIGTELYCFVFVFPFFVFYLCPLPQTLQGTWHAPWRNPQTLLSADATWRPIP